MAFMMAAPLQAAQLSVEIQGIEGEMLASARADLELMQYEERDVSPAKVQCLFERADDQIRMALEPFGYYQARVEGALQQPAKGVYRAVLRVRPGEPAIVRDAHVEVRGTIERLDDIQQALRNFEPEEGERLHHHHRLRAAGLRQTGRLRLAGLRRSVGLRLSVLRAGRARALIAGAVRPGVLREPRAHKPARRSPVN